MSMWGEVNVELFQTVGFILFLSWKSELSKWKTMCWHRVVGSSKVHSHYQYEYNTIRAFKNKRGPTVFIQGSIQWLDITKWNETKQMSFLQSIAIISTPARTNTSKDVNVQQDECDTHCKSFMKPQLWRVGMRSIHESASGRLDYTTCTCLYT